MSKHQSNDPNKEKDVRSQALGTPSQPNIPVGQVVGSGLVQSHDPLNVSRDDTLRLSIPSLSNVKALGGCLSRRYMVSWNENGVEKKGFFTTPQYLNLHRAENKIYGEMKKKYPQYEAELQSIKDFYSSNSDMMRESVPGYVDRLPMDQIGFSSERIEQLKKDKAFKTALNDLSTIIGGDTTRNIMMVIQQGSVASESSRIEMRNVAMTDVGDALGVPNLLARSRVVQMESDGRVMDGVVMEAAVGIEFDDLTDPRRGDCPLRLTKEQAEKTFNTEGLKDLADMQILDYVCMNVDRHEKNLFYRFDDVNSPNPKFLGVQGIDNDYSFGTNTPKKESKEDKLPALYSMKVISEEMLAKINDPKTMEAIEAGMRKNSLSEAEINAAKERLNNVKQAVKDGKFRVVKQGEWGKGENTIDKLADGVENIFERMQNKLITPITKLPPMEKKAEVEQTGPKPSPFAKCVKVDNFDKSLLDNKELEELREKVEEDFRKQVDKDILDTPDILSGKELLEELAKQSKGLTDSLNAADPFFHPSSKEYKNLKKSCKELSQLVQRLNAKYPDGKAELSKEDSELLNDKLNEIQDRSSSYETKKQSEREAGRKPSSVGERRIAASKKANELAGKLKELGEVTLAKQDATKNPLEYLNNRIAKSQMGLSGLSGQNLRMRVAETLYLKGLTKSVIEVRKKEQFKNAMMPDMIKKQSHAIMESSSFQKMCKDMSENELRSLAAEKGGEKLFDKHIDTLTKEMKAERDNPELEAKKTLDVAKEPVEKQKSANGPVAAMA